MKLRTRRRDAWLSRSAIYFIITTAGPLRKRVGLIANDGRRACTRIRRSHATTQRLVGRVTPDGLSERDHCRSRVIVNHDPEACVQWSMYSEPIATCVLHPRPILPRMMRRVTEGERASIDRSALREVYLVRVNKPILNIAEFIIIIINIIIN